MNENYLKKLPTENRPGIKNGLKKINRH